MSPRPNDTLHRDGHTLTVVEVKQLRSPHDGRPEFFCLCEGGGRAWIQQVSASGELGTCSSSHSMMAMRSAFDRLGKKAKARVVAVPEWLKGGT